MENICCTEKLDLTNTTVNTLIVNCCCKCNGGDKPAPPTPEEPEKEYKTMTVKVDLSNSDPATCCTYADDAVGMTAGSAAWDEFFGHYPVMFKDGKEVGKLNPNDFTKFVGGTAADITSGAAGDVMIAFPRRGLKIETVGDVMTVSMTDDPDAAGFEYLAHVRGDERRHVFYLGAYKGFKDPNSKLRSLSGKMPTGSQTIGQFRTLAQANGVGYEQSAFHQLTFRQTMYLLKYANLNSQKSIGRGFVDGNNGALVTGGTEASGMDWGETTGKQHIKLFGIEDFWGNVWERMDGVVSDSNRRILTATTGFNDMGTGYVNAGDVETMDIIGYTSKPQGTVQTGFIPRESKGTESTYFCDYSYLSALGSTCFGGVWPDSSEAGIFRIAVNAEASYINVGIGARLMYL